MHDGQKTGREVASVIVGKTSRIRDDDERRQIIVEAAERVGNPCAHAREAGRHEAGVLHVTGRAMHVRLGSHRHQERQIVDALGDIWKNGADPASALAVLLEFERTLHHAAGRTGGRFDARARIELLAAQFDQLRFVIEGIHLAGAAVHEKLDDALGFGAMMQPAVQLRS